ncbi:MAG: hypothetical protein AB7O65_04290 [Candidatus Korobacteraceae bacterium]
MRFNLIIAITILGILVAGPASAQVVAFEHANVIPMDRERVLQNQTVIVRDGKIAEMGPAASVKVPQGATRIAASDKYLIPGIVEMHGHLPGGPESLRSLEFVEQVLFLYVANGVTTVRGMLGTEAPRGDRSRASAGTEAVRCRPCHESRDRP